MLFASGPKVNLSSLRTQQLMFIQLKNAKSPWNHLKSKAIYRSKKLVYWIIRFHSWLMSPSCFLSEMFQYFPGRGENQILQARGRDRGKSLLNFIRRQMTKITLNHPNELDRTLQNTHHVTFTIEQDCFCKANKSCVAHQWKIYSKPWVFCVKKNQNPTMICLCFGDEYCWKQIRLQFTKTSQISIQSNIKWIQGQSCKW